MKGKALKLLEKNIRGYIYKLRIGKDFLNGTH